jgi:hypothetical protein
MLWIVVLPYRQIAGKTQPVRFRFGQVNMWFRQIGTKIANSFCSGRQREGIHTAFDSYVEDTLASLTAKLHENVSSLVS